MGVTMVVRRYDVTLYEREIDAPRAILMLIVSIMNGIVGHGRLPQASSVAGSRRARGPFQGCDHQAAERGTVRPGGPVAESCVQRRPEHRRRSEPPRAEGIPSLSRHRSRVAARDRGN